jgi:YD repeat-containing protein
MSKLNKYLYPIAGKIVTLLFIGASSYCSAAQAQTVTYTKVPFPPEISSSDENGVNLVSGQATFSVPDIAIGPQDGGLANTVSSFSADTGIPQAVLANGFYPTYLTMSGNNVVPTGPAMPIASNYIGGIAEVTGLYASTTFSFNGTSERFNGAIGSGCTLSGISYVSLSKRGGSLQSNGGGLLTYTDRNGAKYTIKCGGFVHPDQKNGAVTNVVYPNGQKINIAYQGLQTQSVPRITSVESNLGWQLKFKYSVPFGSTNYLLASGIVGLNRSFELCDSMADTCAPTMQWPTSTYAFSPGNTSFNVTDKAGRTTRYTLNAYYEATGLKPAWSDVDTVSYIYCGRTGLTQPCNGSFQEGGTTVNRIFAGMVHKVTKGGNTRTYKYIPYAGGYNFVRQGTHPYFGTQEVSTRTIPGSPIAYIKQDDGTYAGFSGDDTNQVAYVRPAGAPTQNFTYDTRGNVLTVTTVSTSGNAAANIITRANYDATCANIFKCNQANWVEDGRGNRTEYTYDAVHGGKLTETGPAVGGIRPQKRNTYVQRYAWTKNASGAYVQATDAVWMLNSESFCRMGAASGAGCQLQNDEVVTIYDYGPNAGPNNLLVRGIAVTADGQTLRTCYTYDRFGNRISETAPNANLTSCP